MPPKVRRLLAVNTGFISLLDAETFSCHNRGLWVCSIAPRGFAGSILRITPLGKTIKALSTLLTLAMLAATGATAQMSQPMIGENTTKISDHVWAIMGFPNIAIVVGAHSTLVVDTGLGPKNGATVARVVAKLAPNNKKLFLTTTHFHPEHAGGEPGFPPATILIRDAVQQQEMEKHGQEMMDRFSTFSAQNKELLAGVVLRSPDVTFNEEAKIDLGGVTARLLWFGGAHTKGDELTFVEPDLTLISGDVVQNKTYRISSAMAARRRVGWPCWTRSPTSTPNISCLTIALQAMVRWWRRNGP